jgi:undecaprenyl pyrophosphate phosphatase UppP
MIQMRKFAFQELMYAIVVASSYGLLLGLLYNTSSDVWIFFLWILMICFHIMGIIAIERMEEGKKKKETSEK